MLKTAANILLALLLTGCAAVVTIPTSRMQRPQTYGEPHKLQLAGRWERVENNTLANDLSDRDTNFLANSKTTSQGTPNAEADVSLHPEWEVILQGFPLGNNPWQGFLKTQFLGDHLKSVKKGSYAVGATLGFLYLESQKSGDQNGLFGRGGYPWQSYVRSLGHDASLIFGYFLSDQWQIYGGPYYTGFSYLTTIHYNRSDDQLSPESWRRLEGCGYSRGANLDLEYRFGLENRTSLTLEANYNDLRWPNDNSRYGTQISFKFNTVTN